jgi:hypothetical protein
MADYFTAQQADAQGLLTRARAAEVQLAQGTELVNKELQLLTENRDSVHSAIHTNFEKVTII